MPMYPPRKTIYKGIEMRSRLEAGFAAWLDRMGLEWEYEPHAVGDEHGQYLPDFLVQDVFVLDGDGPGAAYFEVKPSSGAADWLRLERAAVALQTATGRSLFLVTPDESPTIVWSTGGWASATWVYGSTPSAENSALITVAALELPFARPWWT